MQMRAKPIGCFLAVLLSISSLDCLAQTPRNPMRDARDSQDARGSQTSGDVDNRGIYPRDRKPSERPNQPPSESAPKSNRPERTAALQQGPPASANAPAAASTENRAAPFPPLTAEEQSQVDQILLNWEKKCDAITTFKCDFTRDTFNQFGNPKEGFKSARAKGQIKYQKPDHGKIQVTSEQVWDADKNNYVESKEVLEHWVCDGKNVYYFIQADKQLVENPIPKDMQGNAISQGPLPFVFGAKAADIKARYFVREDKSAPPEYVRLEIFPRYQADAGNYRRVVFVLMRKTYEPAAIELENPGQNTKEVVERDTYRFRDVTINSFAWKLLDEFGAPSVPRGWKKVVQSDATEAQSTVAQPPRRPSAPERK